MLRIVLQWASALMIGVLGLCGPALAATPAAASYGTIVMLSPRGSLGDLAPFEAALEGHMAPYGLEITTATVRRIPSTLSSQSELARRILDEHAATAVVWIDAPRERLILLHRTDSGQERMLERELECPADRLDQCCDAMASVVSSAISSWLGHTQDSSNAPEPTYADDNELAPVELNKVPWQEPEPFARIFLSANYGALFHKGTLHTAHGFGINAGTLLVKYLLIEVAGNLYWPITTSFSDVGGTLKFLRWDCSLLVGGSLPLGRWRLGLLAGMILDFSTRRSLSKNLHLNSSDDYRPGLSIAADTSFLLSKRVSLFLVGGVDILARDTVYRSIADDGTRGILRLDSLQWRVALGVRFGISAGVAHR